MSSFLSALMAGPLLFTQSTRLLWLTSAPQHVLCRVSVLRWLQGQPHRNRPWLRCCPLLLPMPWAVPSSWAAFSSRSSSWYAPAALWSVCRHRDLCVRVFCSAVLLRLCWSHLENAGELTG